MGKNVNGTSTKRQNEQESHYTDLQDNSRVSRDYTELQSRNDDYSDIDATGHGYVNTELQA